MLTQSDLELFFKEALDAEALTLESPNEFACDVGLEIQHPILHMVIYWYRTAGATRRQTACTLISCVCIYVHKLLVACRYRVVYRLVNTVYIMAIASAAANVFALMKLVDALTAIATIASRGVEVTPEKLSRRYPEVCLE